MKKTALTVLLLCVVALQYVGAQTYKTITSPNGKVELTIFSSQWGVPGYSIKVDGDTLINDSQLGLRYSGSESSGHFIEKVNYKWERTDSLAQVKYNEMIVSFNQPYKGVYRVYARAYDNGYALKQAYKLGSAEKTFLQDDNTAISFASEAEVMQNGNRLDVDSISAIPFPVDIKLENGKGLTLSCDALEGYPQMNLSSYPQLHNVLKVGLVPMYKGNDLVKAVLPIEFETPFVRVEIKD